MELKLKIKIEIDNDEFSNSILSKINFFKRKKFFFKLFFAIFTKNHLSLIVYI